MTGRATEVGPSPCESEGRCPFWDLCRDDNLECDSFRHYLNADPRIGIDKKAEKSNKAYRFIADRGQALKHPKVKTGEIQYVCKNHR